MKKFSILKMFLFTLFVLISLTACGQKSIKLIDYATVEFKGLDEKATANVELDAQGIMKQVLEAEGKKDNSIESLATLADIDGVEYEVSPKENLKNGDKITLKVYPKGEGDNKKKYKLVAGEKTIVVEGLEKGTKIDLFKDIKLVYKGISPELSVSVVNESTDPFLNSVSYETSSYYAKKGDKIIVKATYSENKAEEYKYIVDTKEKEYTVENVDEYLAEAKDIDNETMNKIKKESQDIADSYLVNEASQVLYKLTDDLFQLNEKVDLKTSAKLAQIQFLKAKDPKAYGSKNLIYLIYEISVSNKKYPTALKGYLAVQFKDAVKLSDGKIDIKYGDGRAKYVLKKLDDVQSEVITANRGEYEIEQIMPEK